MEFPYDYRKDQLRMVSDIEEVLNLHSHIVIEAPTGFGKTISSLYPAIKHAIKHDLKILYLVRTNSQERKVIEESKKLGVLAVGLQGRAHMCPLAAMNEDLSTGNAEEISLLCSKLKKEVQAGNAEACPYYAGYLEFGEDLRDFIREVHTSEEIFLRGLDLGVCPYEAIGGILSEALVVAVPYIYFLHPMLRDILLDRMRVSLSDLIIIVDEAHNFPDFARELRSDELTVNSIDLMEKECLEFGNREVLGIPCVDVAEYLRDAIYRLEEFVNEDDEGMVPHYAYEEFVMSNMNSSVNHFEHLAVELARYGMEIREIKMSRRKLPRSHIYHAGTFLLNWHRYQSYDFLHIVKLGENPKIEIFNLDPSPLTEIIRSAHASIHMSGTLILDHYRDVVNLPENTLLRRYASPFPKENLLVLYATDVTTRYGEVDTHIERIAYYIRSLSKLGRNMAVFFPSYSLMNAVLNVSELDPFIEERGMKQSEFHRRVNEFKKKGGIMFSVFGGRVSEGFDFPGEELEIVVIAGIPYPRPTVRQRMLEKYYDYKFGKGWEFAFKAPALIKIRQAIGRLIRSESDRGVAIILDKRAVRFSREIEMKESNDILTEVKSFFEGTGIRKRGGGASS